MTTLAWRLDFDASPHEVWAVFADTDGFNRAAGLDFHFERVDGEMRGSTKVAGIPTTWVETPITWERPKGFVSRRTYDSGPIKTATATVTLTPREGGTTLDYRIELQPRNPLLALPVKVVAATLIRPGLYRALVMASEVVRGERNTVDTPPPLTPEQAEALTEALEPIDPAVAAILRRHIEEDPLPAQHAMRPLQIAADEQLDPDDVLRECLLASTSGALELELQVLCPRCRGAHHQGTVIELKAQGVHCPTCDIHYDGHLAENMEVVFAPGRRIRDVEVPIDCVFSPERTPHVLSKVSVKPGRVSNFEVELQPGGYRLEGPESETWVIADPSCETDRVFVDLKPMGFMPTGLRVRPGRVRVTVRNRHDDWATLSVRARWRPPHALTVAEMFTYPSAREVLPEGVRAGVGSRIEPGVVLAIEGPPRAVQRAMQLLESPITEQVDSGLALLVCPELDVALEELERLGRADDFLNVGVASGVVVALTKEQQTSYGGPAVEAALRVMQSVSRPGIGLHPSLLDEAREVLASRCEVVDRGLLAPLLRFPRPRRTAPAEAPEPPTHIGDYRFLQPLADEVFQVADAKERRWALHLRAWPDLAPERLQRFYTEGHVAHTHRHRNLVEVFDWGDHEGHLYVVTELLVGESLEATLKKRRRLPEKDVLRILTGAASAMVALQAAGFTYRALDASSVFLLAEPTDVPHAVKLLDHGLCRDLDPEPPPQDPRTDVYALAALGFRVLSGTPAWRGDVLTEDSLARLGVPPDKLAWGRVPVPWQPVLTQALQLDPAARHSDPAALIAALRAL